MSLAELSVLRYDQSVSLAEMLNAWCQSASEETLAATRLKISHYTHPFPYRIALFDDVLSKVGSLEITEVDCYRVKLKFDCKVA